MKTYENLSANKLAITLNDGARTPRDEWIKSEIIMEYSKVVKQKQFIS
jgi:hypothetical protein